MANPYVALGNYEYDPPSPIIERHYFTMVDFNNTKFFTYAESEREDSSFMPQGDKYIYFENLKDAIVDKPDFIDDSTWSATNDGGLSKAPSGFLTGANTIMPKVMVPSTLLVDNGLRYEMGSPELDSTKMGLMSWSSQNPGEMITIGGDEGSRFVSLNGKKDDQSSNVLYKVIESGLGGSQPFDSFVYYLANEGEPKFDFGDSFVGSGAFMIMANVIPNEKGGQNTDSTAETKWKINFDTTNSGGELVMTLDESGSLIVDINGQITKAQLSEAKAKDNAPQNAKFKEGSLYTIVVYPVWNGIVVSSGVQDSSASVESGSQYCIMNKSAHIMSPPWGNEFNMEEARDNPEDYEMRVSSQDVQMLLDWKPSTEPSSLNVTASNCRLDVAYVPLFFSQNCKFDVYCLVGKDSTEVSHDYYIHPIYTRNGNTGTRLRYEKDSYTQEYGDSNEYIRFSFEMYLKGEDDETIGYPGRRGGEVFGYVYHVKETTTYTSINGNGNFPVSSPFWSGGTTGDPNPTSWQDYIMSANCTYNLDGSSGTLSVDKYGCSGQNARANQVVGSITINALGMNNAGRIFTGIAEGIGESDDSGGGTWNIILNGLERKLQDIVLINAPFFDGYTLGDVCDFLCKYGGLDANYSKADVTVKLPASTDINNPIVDFKTGTPIIQALQTVMELTHHWFVIQPDGRIHFYELSTNDCLPVTLGPDRSSSYANYNYIMSTNLTPDFEDIRNEIIVIGLKQMGGTNTSLKDFQLFPLITWQKQTTTPNYPWSRPWVYPIKGYVNQSILTNVYNNIKGFTQRYEVQGSLTIPGDSRIWVYDQWTLNGQSYVITSVSHNLDLASKTWTTDLEFATGR